MLFFFFFQAEDGIRDLTVTGVQTCALPISRDSSAVEQRSEQGVELVGWSLGGGAGRQCRRSERAERSEEHTSELQSQSNLVCRLLLEKKKPSPAKLWRRALPPCPWPCDLSD